MRRQTIAIGLLFQILVLLPIAAAAAPADRATAAVQQVSETYRLALTWAGRTDPLPADAWRWTSGIELLPDGRALLLDQATGRLIRLEGDGSAALLFAPRGLADDLAQPSYLAADAAQDRIYVAEPGQGAVHVFDLAGNPRGVWGGLPEPAGLAASGDGGLWVAAAGSGELLRLDAEGRRLGAWPVVSPAAGGGLLAGLDLGSDGRLYVADGRQARLHVLDADGRRSGSIDVDLPGLSAFDLRDIAVEQFAGQKNPVRYWVATSEGLWSQDTRSGDAWRRASVASAWGVDLHASSGIWVTVPEGTAQGSRVAVLPFTQGGSPAVPSWRGRPVLRSGDLDGPEVLSLLDGGQTVAVLDRGDRLQAFSGAEPPAYAQLTPAGSPLKVCGSGEEPALSDGRHLRRYRRQGDTWTLRWQLDLGAGMQVSAMACAPDGRITVLDGLRDRLLPVDDQGNPGPTVALQTAAGTVWADLDRAADGSLVALDRAGRRLLLVAPDGRQRSLNLSESVRRVAAGAGGRVFTLDRDGWVRRYEVQGAVPVLEATFDATRFDRAQQASASDLVVAADGTVLVADRAANLISHFRPEPASGPPETVAEGSCRSFPAMTALPGAVALGEQVGVRLSLRGGCGAKVGGATRDIVLVLDNSASMAGEKLDSLRVAALHFVAEVDLSRSRVGVVTFNEDGRVAQALTGDIDTLQRSLAGLQTAAPDKVTAIDRGLREGREHLRQRGRPGVPGVIILISDGGSDYDLAVAEADQAKAAGVEIYSIGIQAWQRLMRAVATDATHAYAIEGGRFLFGVFERIAGSLTAFVLYQRITVMVDLPPDFDLVAGSAQPGAAWDAAARRLTWQLDGVLPAGFVLSYRLLPRRTGPAQPVSRAAWGDTLDGFGRTGRVDFPPAQVDVSGPTATPLPPASATPSPTASPTDPPSPTATATRTQRPTAVPRPIYIPLVLREKACLPAEQHADVALVIDNSNSMVGPKLEAARTAATLFIDLLQLPADQAAVVAFNSQAQLASSLSGDRTAHRAAIAALGTGAGTRMETGLRAALAELESPRRRPGNSPAIVLLTDGRQDGEPELALAAAALARGQGMAVFTIGLGGDVDLPFLAALAGSPTRAFQAPGPQDLAGIYRQVAFQVPCPAEVYWARR